MEIEKTPHSQSNFEKRRMELEESTFLTLNYTTKLQSLRQCGIDQKKPETQTNGTR